MKSAIKEFSRAADAGAMIEFAVAVGFFFMILVAILNFGYAAWERNSVATDAREGARFAMVRGAGSGRSATANDVQTYVRSKSSLGSSVVVNTTWDAADHHTGSVVNVTVIHVRTGRLFLPDTVRSTASMIIVN